MSAEQDIQTGLDRIWSSDFVQKNPKKSYQAYHPDEYNRVKAYVEGGSAPSPWPTTLLGDGLALVERGRRAAAPAPTPPPSDAYFVNDYSTQDFRTPWTTLFSHTSPGWVDVSGAPTRTTPDGRVAVASDPDGSGYAARMEMRDSDPGWASSPTLQKSEVRTVTQQTMNKSTLSVGDVRWFSTRIWLPDNAQERFEWPTSGADTFFTILGIHPGSSSMGGATSIEWYAGSKWVTFRLNGGTPPGGATESVPLWRLLNDDGSRYAPSYNRWIDLVFGVRFAPDSTGWFEAWVDGVNVYPRKNRPTMWAGDTTPYFKYGLYKQKSSSFPSGKSVIYFGRTTIGYSKP